MAIDRAQWEQLAARLRTRWPDQLSNIKSEAYFSALSDLGKDELGKGVDALIASDSQELPSPAELRAAATGEPAAAGPRQAATAEPEERRIAGIPSSWLLSALVAVVVAAVIVVVFVVVFDDNGSSDAAPPAFEKTSVENELIAFDWGDELATATATCEEEMGGVIACEVVFENDEKIDVSVTQNENGELTIDVPEGEQPGSEGGGSGGGSSQQAPTPGSP